MIFMPDPVLDGFNVDNYIDVWTGEVDHNGRAYSQTGLMQYCFVNSGQLHVITLRLACFNW